MLARWRWKASAWKLNKMKAEKFIKLTRNLVKQVTVAHWQHYYQRWLDFDLKMQMLVKIRLLFRCWKTAVIGIKAGRRKAMRRVLRVLHYRAANVHRRVQKILEKRRARVQLYVLHCWLLRLKKKIVLRRLFCIGEKAWMQRAINSWKSLLHRRTIMPRLSQSIELHAPTPIREEVRVSQKAVFQSGDKVVYRKVTTVHRRGCSCCNRFPVDRSQPTAPPSSSISSLRDKIAWRLGVVKDLDKSFQEHESITKPLWMSDSPLPSPRDSRLDSMLPYQHYQHQPDISSPPSHSRHRTPPPSIPRHPTSAHKKAKTPHKDSPSMLFGGVMGGASSGNRKSTPRK